MKEATEVRSCNRFVPAGTLRTVDLLKAGDPDAWARVREKTVRLEMSRFRYSGMVKKWRISEDELLAMLFEDMVGRGKLSLYRGEGSLYGWLGKYVVGYIHRANPAWNREIPLSLAHTESAVVSEELLRYRDWRRFAERCFGWLWRKNPIRAYVYYLKQGEGLSSREVKNLLGLSSEANVDKLTSRFKREFGEMVVSDA